MQATASGCRAMEAFYSVNLWNFFRTTFLHSKTQQRFLCVIAVMQRGTAVIFTCHSFKATKNEGRIPDR